MKKLKNIILLIVISMMLIPNVKAANYEVKELIPVGVSTTVVTKHFSYKGINYDTLDNKITFNTIKNISKDEIPLSISIGLFDKNRYNIGIINVCTKEKMLAPGAESDISIKINETFLPEKNTFEDVKYFTVLEDNITCKVNSTLDEVGKKVEDIGTLKQSVYKGDAKNLINVYAIIFGILFVLFIYEFMFTTKYRNMDGKDVRRAMKTKKKKKKRPTKKVEKVDPDKVINPTKTKEMALKEKMENQKSESDDNDLMNMYNKGMSPSSMTSSNNTNTPKFTSNESNNDNMYDGDSDLMDMYK